MSEDTRVAVITGAASGLGLAIAERLAGDGFSVVIADIDDEAAKAAAERLGDKVLSVHCDVTSRTDVEDVRDAATETFGGVDLLVNNAGFDSPGFFLHTDESTWTRLIEVNLMGVLRCTQVLMPSISDRCRATGYGRIVNIASDAGRVGSMGEAVYSAAKGGVIAFSKSMARELARDKVTVNAVCPGPADTPMTAAISSTELGQKFMDGMIKVTPLKRLVTPDEVAAAVGYFASEEARFVTGQVLSVSGGLTMAG